MFEGLEKVLGYRRGILYFSLGSIVSVFTLYQVMNHWNANDPTKYLSAQIAYEKGILDKVKEAIKEHPELQSRYTPLIIQKQLENRGSEVGPEAERILKRTKEESPYYSMFAKTSLLISQGGLKEALIESKKLKKELIEDKNFWDIQKTTDYGSILYAYNLMRIAVLENEVGSPQEELAAWNDLETEINKNSERYTLFLQNFKQQDLSLFDYITYRKETISRGS